MALMQVERQLSFAGGMNSLAAPAEYGADELSYNLNGLPEIDGITIKPRPGSKRTHASELNSGAQCYGATEYHDASGNQQIVVFMGDKMFTSTDEGASWTQRATSLSTAYWSLVQMRVGSSNYLCCANGSSNIYYWDGTTWGTLSGAPSGAKYLAVFNGRLYAAGHAAETVAASAVGDPTGWSTPSAFEVKIHTHDGDNEITGLYTIGSVLLAFKRSSTGYIEGFGYQTLQVSSDALGISRSVGCVGHRTIVAVGDQAVCWLSERGVEFWQMGGAITLLSGKLQPTVADLAWATIVANPGLCHAAYLERENEYRVAVPTTTTTTDLVIGVRPPRAGSNLPVSLWLEDHPDGDVDQDTVFVSSGYLAFQSGASQSKVSVVGGYLSIDASGTSFVALSSGYLSLATSTAQHAALFVADRLGNDLAGELWSGGFDGFVRYLKEGTKDDVASDDSGGQDVTMTLRSRPFLFGDAFRRTKARIIRATTQQPAAADVALRVISDGVSGTQKTVTTEAVSYPQSIRAMVSAKAQAHIVELQAAGDIEVTGFELAAEQLRTPW